MLAGVGFVTMKLRNFYIVLIATAIFLTPITTSVMAAPPANTPRLAQNTEVEKGLDKIKEPFSGVANFDTRDPYKLIGNAIKLALQIGFAIAVIFVIIGGYFYVTSAGNEEQATRGRKTIIYSLIGIVVMIMAYVIVSVVVNLISTGGT